MAKFEQGVRSEVTLPFVSGPSEVNYVEYILVYFDLKRIVMFFSSNLYLPSTVSIILYFTRDFPILSLSCFFYNMNSL